MMLLKDIAVAASMGVSTPAAVKARAITLYPIAHAKFSLMMLSVLRDTPRKYGMWLRSWLRSVMSAAEAPGGGLEVVVWIPWHVGEAAA